MTNILRSRRKKMRGEKDCNERIKKMVREKRRPEDSRV